MSSVLFGSIGTLADTSELQRASFNEAFAEHGLDWTWSQEEYRTLLRDSGGAQRIATFAQEQGAEVDAAEVHRTKSRIFQEKLAADGVQPRPGVAQTIDAAHRDGIKVALVTTTSGENLKALGAALHPQIDFAALALVVDTDSVEEAKPAPDAYRFALAKLQEEPGDCVAIEDNVGGLRAAVSAGIACIAFPGENNADHDFEGARERVDALSLESLRAVIESTAA